MSFSFEKSGSVVFVMRKNIARLWPVLFFSVFCAFILSLFKLTYFHKYGNICALLFLDDAYSVNIPTNNGAAWYINVMFWGYVCYYCVLKLFDHEKRLYVISLVVFCCYSVLLDKLHLYNQPQMFGIVTIPMVRGIAGMGLGYLISEFYRRYTFLPNRSYIRMTLYTVVELFVLYLLIRTAIIKKLDIAFPIILICFLLLFFLFLFKKGWVSCLLDRPAVSFMGKYCFSIYMMQEIMFPIVNRVLWKNSCFGASVFPVFNMICGIMLCIILGVFTYHLVEKPMRNFLLNRFL